MVKKRILFKVDLEAVLTILTGWEDGGLFRHLGKPIYTLNQNTVTKRAPFPNLKSINCI